MTALKWSHIIIALLLFASVTVGQTKSIVYEKSDTTRFDTNGIT